MQQNKLSQNSYAENSSFKVLFVDDDEEVRDLLRLLLRDEEVVTHFAADAQVPSIFLCKFIKSKQMASLG